MAHYVVAGLADCPFYAQAEALANALQSALPSVRLTTRVILQSEWPAFLAQTTAAQNWTHAASPLVYKQLAPGNSRGILIGGFSEFSAHVREWYGVDAVTEVPDAARLAPLFVEANVAQAQLTVARPTVARALPPGLRICFVGATSSLAYAALTSLALEPAWRTAPWHLLLVASASDEGLLEGVGMELEDCALASLASITTTTNVRDGARCADCVCLCVSSSIDDDELAELVEHVVAAAPTAQIVLAGDVDPQTVAARMSARLTTGAKARVSIPAGVRQGQAQAFVARALSAPYDQLDLKVTAGKVANVVVFGANAGAVDLFKAVVHDFGAVVRPGLVTPLPALLTTGLVDPLAAHLQSRSSKYRSNAVLASATALARHIKHMYGDGAREKDAFVCAALFDDVANTLSIRPAAFDRDHGVFATVSALLPHSGAAMNGDPLAAGSLIESVARCTVNDDDPASNSDGFETALSRPAPGDTLHAADRDAALQT